jgi:hypothetical protein
MTPEYILDVERDASKALGHSYDIRRSDKQEHRVWIDEATNEPGTGDAVDFWTGAGHPHGSSLRINWGKLGKGN